MDLVILVHLVILVMLHIESADSGASVASGNLAIPLVLVTEANLVILVRLAQLVTCPHKQI